MASAIPSGKYVWPFLDCHDRLLCWRKHLEQGGTPENFSWCSLGYGDQKWIAFPPELEQEIENGRPFPQFAIGYDDDGKPKIFVFPLRPDDKIETRTWTDENGVKRERRTVKYKEKKDEQIWVPRVPNDDNNNLSSPPIGGYAASSSNSKPDLSFGQLVRENDRVVIFTDGSCFNNGKSNAKAGIGVYFSDNSPLNVSAPVVGKQSNGRAELLAAVKALMIVRDKKLGPVQIRTDSVYVKQGITTWIQTWKANGWRTAGGNKVKNVGDWKELDALRSSLDVEWKWVEAHKGIHGNEMADKLANEGANKNR